MPILLVCPTPHCRYINLQWGYCWYAANAGKEAISVTLPVNFSKRSFISLFTNYDYTILGETHGLLISADNYNNKTAGTLNFYDLAPEGNNNNNGVYFLTFGL